MTSGAAITRLSHRKKMDRVSCVSQETYNWRRPTKCVAPPGQFRPAQLKSLRGNKQMRLSGRTGVNHVPAEAMRRARS